LIENQKEEYDAGGAHTRAQHIVAHSALTNPFPIPEGWEEVADPLEWLKRRGALLTRASLHAVNLQYYHALEYFMSSIRKSMAGEKSTNFVTNLLQQLRADGFYVKSMSRGPELCLAWGCFQITFAAFEYAQESDSSGENTLVKLICHAAELNGFKEAVLAGTHSTYFRLVAPKESVAEPLVASARVIQQTTEGDHARPSTSRASVAPRRPTAWSTTATYTRRASARWRRRSRRPLPEATRTCERARSQ
jgi:hypothetical protein